MELGNLRETLDVIGDDRCFTKFPTFFGFAPVCIAILYGQYCPMMPMLYDHMLESSLRGSLDK